MAQVRSLITSLQFAISVELRVLRGSSGPSGIWSSSHCSLLKCLQSSCCSGLLYRSIPLQQQGGISFVPRPIDFHAEQLVALKVLRLLRVFLSGLIKAGLLHPTL